MKSANILISQEEIDQLAIQSITEKELHIPGLNDKYLGIYHTVKASFGLLNCLNNYGLPLS